ncbi:MAG: hypothetical protein CSB48_11010 [Proteobacteria bacterium]|nr:MAG: hypothetical protein CSB48_11010 [Pseudomonadota bacterium]PIE40067.1 MAG: hypothetical protein CSA51_02770 [Gammaproteobacteria bacterium]
MGFHFIPLVAGVAIGAVSTYLYKDERVRSAIAEKMSGFGKKGEPVASAQSPVSAEKSAEPVPSEPASG